MVTHLGGFINDTVADGYTHQVDTYHIRSSETEEGRGRGKERAKVGEEKRLDGRRIHTLVNESSFLLGVEFLLILVVVRLLDDLLRNPNKKANRVTCRVKSCEGGQWMLRSVSCRCTRC